MLVLLRLAFFSLKSRAVTTSLTVLSIALSVFLLVGVDRIRHAAQEGFACSLKQTDLVVGARGGELPLLFYAVFHIGAPSSEISYTSYEHFRDHPAVQWTIPLSMGDSHHGYRVIATDENFYEHYRFHGDRSLQFVAGTSPEGIFDAVIGSEVAERLGYHVGSKIVLSHGLEDADVLQHDVKLFTIVGILTRTATPVDRAVYITLYGEEAIHLDWGNAATASREEIPSAIIGNEGLRIRNISAFLVRTRSQVDTQLLLREINNYRNEPLTAIVPTFTLQELWRIVGFADVALSLISGAVLFVALLALLIGFYAAVNERKKEVAVLRTIGFHAHQVFVLFVLESTLISTAGMVVGLAAVYGLLWFLRVRMEAHFGIPLAMVGLSWRVALYVCVVVLVGALLGGVPAVRAWRNGLLDGFNVQ